jgi:hypothetical protein
MWLWNKARNGKWLVNLPTFAPAVCVLVLVTLAPYLVNIAADCPPANPQARYRVSTVDVPRPWRKEDQDNLDEYLTEAYSRKGNPLFCKTEQWWPLFKSGFDESLALIRQGWTEEDSKSNEKALNPIIQNQKALQSKLEKILHTNEERAADQTTSITDQITVLNEQLRIAQERISELRGKPDAILTVAAREAAARLFWIWSLAILFVTSAIVIGVGCWIIVDIILDKETYFEQSALLIALTTLFVFLGALGLKPVAGIFFWGGIAAS